MKLTDYQNVVGMPARGPSFVMPALIESLGNLYGVIAAAALRNEAVKRPLMVEAVGYLLQRIALAANLLGATMTTDAKTTRSPWLVEEVAGLVLRLRDIEFKRPSPEVAFATKALADECYRWTRLTLEEVADLMTKEE